MIEKFGVPQKKYKLTANGRRKKLMHLLITGKLLRFPAEHKEEVLSVVAELKEKHKRSPNGKIYFY